jgi:arylsulfatase
MLKDSGQYDNTLIMFTSDNGTSEPAALLNIKFSTISPDMASFVDGVNNTLSNLGNGTSVINYAAWGAESSASPLSGYKTTEYEGGTRVPFIVKEPGSDVSQGKVVKAFAYTEDITPTILNYANIQHPGSTYNGRAVHPIMGKSLNALFNGTVDRIYGENDTVADEMFNNSVVWMGDWKAIRHQPPVGDGKRQLHNLATDVTETIDVGEKHPDILQKMISAYDTYAKNVGVIIPRGQAYFETASATPPVNQSEVTISSGDITPEKFAGVN